LRPPAATNSKTPRASAKRTSVALIIASMRRSRIAIRVKAATRLAAVTLVDDA
jgi:hypothetical protein